MSDLRAALSELAAEAPHRDLDLPRLLGATRTARRRRAAARILATVVVTMAAAGTVGLLAPDGRDQVIAPADPALISTSPPAPSASPPPPPPGPASAQRRVEVFFADDAKQCGAVRAVSRDVPREAPLRPAIEQLFAGPTPAEEAAGLSAFAVPDLLRSARVLDGVVYVDLVEERFPPNATTSCGSAIFMATLQATASGIVPGAPLVVALNGDPRRYVNALQFGCPNEPPAKGDRCDARGF